MRTVQGKRALITGAAGGLGLAIATRLARDGAKVALLDKNAEALLKIDRKLLGAEEEPLHLPCDLRDDDCIAGAVERLITEWGGVDILVNNAGVAYYGRSHEMSKDEWQEILEVNLIRSIELTRLLLPQLLAQPESHIVNVASMYGYFVTNRSTAYHLTKFGLIGFSEALRAEYARTNLGVTALCPGFVKTGLFRSMSCEGDRDRSPPSWICTSAEKVASQAVRSITRNRRLVKTGWLAHVTYLVRRVMPGLFDSMYHLGRPRWIKRR
jgi:3-oxoacyl-[acyl-carrier protein] reductase